MTASNDSSANERVGRRVDVLLPPELGEIGIVQRLRQNLGSVGLPKTPRVLVGYSGGADSLALLGALSELQRLELLEVRAVHVDHGARDRSSDDASLAVQIAVALGVTCEVQHVPPEARAQHRGRGREEALRRERYRAFAETALRWQADAVALAHHQRDQAETVLLHLMRGAGLQGVSGMQPVTTLIVPWWFEDGSVPPHSLCLLRPFLSEPHAEILAFVDQLGLPVLHDETNEDVTYRRNAVRHELLPVMERVSPGSTANIARFAELATADNAALDEIAGSVLADAAAASGSLATAIERLPRGIQRRVVRRWVTDRMRENEVSLDRIDAILESLLNPSRPRTIEIGGGCSVHSRHGRLTIQLPEDVSSSE